MDGKSGRFKWARKSHKTTLFHTVAHFSARQTGGQALSSNQNSVFCNEVKDLATFVEAASH
jgi:hypothetical protein